MPQSTLALVVFSLSLKTRYLPIKRLLNKPNKHLNQLLSFLGKVLCETNFCF